ncbi:hypothetical protein SAMN00120144_3100 [Hymenobacter roseosalivarius DSM 11622]|uniref:Lipoprotein n=1 Tax=Hymenobacter roseosalivarius DSM 11622 TaxID=645990 RepID=A0A1W1UEQ3_9BACT|nr:hypothetical protein [Hymenobacter roseosalivarius]SMB79264.1 hypothetical protein SAMN00120144_3100 [Hymenobacter roseosalivarius DSM 11622]
MKNLLLSAVLLLALAGCQPSETKAPAATADAPATAAPAAAGAGAGLPAPLPTSAVDIRPAVEQLLPAEGYLHVVSAKALRIEPLQVALPPLWGSLKAGAARSMPGYRIGYEAVIKWVPKGYGTETVPASMPLYAPTGRDTLARFLLGGINPIVPGSENYTSHNVAPEKPVTVRGTVYAFTGQDNQQQPALVVYPYRDKGGVPQASKMTFLPLSQ